MEKNQSTNLGPSSPFNHYTFYFDIVNNPFLLETLKEDIILLGGVIKNFLGKSVRYIVTNRPLDEWPTKPSEELSTMQIHNANNASFSRGKLLLAKSSKVSKKTSVDVLELARVLGIKIIQASTMMAFCKKHAIKSQYEHKTKKNLEATAYKLSIPFIKVLDSSNLYRTNFKEFADWPELNTEYSPELCPFFKKPKQSCTSIEPILSQQSFKTTTLMNQQGVRFNDKCTVLTTPMANATGAAMRTLSISKTNTLTLDKHPAKKKMAYCEICHGEYEEFEQHLYTKKHDDYLRDDSNYDDLKQLIESLPTNFIDTEPSHESTSFNQSLSMNQSNESAYNDSLDEEMIQIASYSRRVYDAVPTMQSNQPMNSFTPVPKTFLALHELAEEKD